MGGGVDSQLAESVESDALVAELTNQLLNSVSASLDSTSTTLHLRNNRRDLVSNYTNSLQQLINLGWAAFSSVPAAFIMHSTSIAVSCGQP